MLLFIIVFISVSTNCFAFNTQNDWTPGRMALFYDKNSHFWSRFDLGVFDASIRTQPSDTKAIERRIEFLGILGTEQVLNNRFAMRLNFISEMAKIRKTESDDQSQIADSLFVKVTPSIDATFVTDAGLEVFAGAAAPYYGKQKTRVNAQDGSSEIRLDSAVNFTPRIGFTRRGSAWSGGFYYSSGREVNRGVTRVDAGGNILTGSDSVYDAPIIGVYGEIKANAIYDFEINSVQEGGGGQKTETGANVRSDYLRVFLGSTLKLEPVSLRFGLAHQTLSYSDSSYMSIDSIPTSSARTLIVFLNGKNQMFLGGILGYGQDRQSLPEINAAYRMFAFTLTTGFNILW